MKYVLVTGSGGFTGSWLGLRYRERFGMIGLDVRPSVGIPWLGQYRADICDKNALEEIFAKYPISHVVHTAAEKSLAVCEADKARARRVNYDATLKLAELAVKHGARFVFLSSDQVFDGRQGRYTEMSEPSPINNYGKLKMLAEKELLPEKSVAICRTALVFGPIPLSCREDFERVRNSEEVQVQSYIVQHTRSRLALGRNIHLPADEYASPTHVELLGQQLARIMERDMGGIFHCCGGEETSRFQLGLKIAEKYDLPTRAILDHSGSDPLRPRNVSLSVAATESRLGMRFPGIAKMLEMPL